MSSNKEPSAGQILQDLLGKPIVRLDAQNMTMEEAHHVLSQLFQQQAKGVLIQLHLYNYKYPLLPTLHLHGMESLETLSLSKSFIGDAGIISLANSLANFPNLHTLNLGSNDIGPLGASEFALAAKRHGGIKILNLSRNKLGSLGCIKLAKALMVEENGALQGLDLASNQIGDVAIVGVISPWLARNHTKLQSLNLYGNQITDLGARSIASALQLNVSLRELNLSFNLIDDPGATLIANALKMNHTLERLLLGSNQIWLEIQKRIRFHLSQNKQARRMFALRSANEIRRLGKKSALRRIPQEIIRLVFCMLRPQHNVVAAVT